MSVYNDPSTDSDDIFPLVVGVGTDGIARYDPADMLFYEENMDAWTLNNVIFIATDAWDSKANSLPVTFRVLPLEFTIQEPNQTWVDLDGIAIYSGIGLPGKQVSVSIGGNPVNTTVVQEDGTWELGVPASRLSQGLRLELSLDKAPVGQVPAFHIFSIPALVFYTFSLSFAAFSVFYTFW